MKPPPCPNLGYSFLPLYKCLDLHYLTDMHQVHPNTRVKCRLQWHGWWLSCIFLLVIGTTTFADPLVGTYDVGGGAMNFPTVAAAVNSLSANGVSGPTLFRVFGGTYSGPIQFNPIAGASDAWAIDFRRADNTSSVSIQSSGSDTSVIFFAGACYVTLDDFAIVAAGNVLRAVSISASSHDLILENCSLRGNLVANGAGIWMRGAGCDRNVFAKLTLHRFADGLNLDGLSAVNSGTIIEYCRIDSVRRVAPRQCRRFRQPDSRRDDLRPLCGRRARAHRFRLGRRQRVQQFHL